MTTIQAILSLLLIVIVTAAVSAFPAIEASTKASIIALLLILAGRLAHVISNSLPSGEKIQKDPPEGT